MVSARRSRGWGKYLAAVFMLSACGGAAPVAENADGPAEKTPEAAAEEFCADVALVGADVEFQHVTYGEQIAIDGVPNAGPETCTTRPCPKNEPCCNRCNSSYVVTITGEARTATAIQLAGLSGCTGSECGVDCDPFGREPKRAYRFVGSLVDEPAVGGAKHVFAVKLFCALP